MNHHQSHTILMVDDEADIRITLVKRLAKRQFKVRLGAYLNSLSGPHSVYFG